MMPSPSPMAQGPGQAPMMPPQGQQYQQQPQSRQTSAGNLAAASFIDMDALPDWLRSSGDGQQGGAGQGQRGMGNYPRQASSGVPARPENVRVPGRPRGNVAPQEESEVAANVFASMLGVASNAPYLPGQGAPGQQLQSGQLPPQPRKVRHRWVVCPCREALGLPGRRVVLCGARTGTGNARLWATRVSGVPTIRTIRTTRTAEWLSNGQSAWRVAAASQRDAPGDARTARSARTAGTSQWDKWDSLPSPNLPPKSADSLILFVNGSVVAN